MHTSPDLSGVSQNVNVVSRSPALSRQEELTLQDYADRMSTAAAMLAQLNASVVRENVTTIPSAGPIPGHMSNGNWIPSPNWITNYVSTPASDSPNQFSQQPITRMKLQKAEADAIRERIMQEMNSL